MCIRNGCSAWVADTFRYLLPLGIPRGPQMSLDAILKLRKLPSPCAIKIDVEGSELEVLKGGDFWATKICSNPVMDQGITGITWYLPRSSSNPI